MYSNNSNSFKRIWATKLREIQKAENRLGNVKVSRSDDRPKTSFKYLLLTTNINNPKLRQIIPLKEKHGQLLTISFFMQMWKQQGTASNNLSIREKSSAVHHLDAVLCPDLMSKCFSAFQRWTCTGHFHLSSRYPWPNVNITDIKSILPTMTCLASHSLSSRSPRPSPLPPRSTITRIYSSQGPNPVAVSTPIREKLPLYQIWSRVQYLWRAHLTADRS